MGESSPGDSAAGGNGLRFWQVCGVCREGNASSGSGRGVAFTGKDTEWSSHRGPGGSLLILAADALIVLLCYLCHLLEEQRAEQDKRGPADRTLISPPFCGSFVKTSALYLSSYLPFFCFLSLTLTQFFCYSHSFCLSFSMSLLFIFQVLISICF